MRLLRNGNSHSTSPRMPSTQPPRRIPPPSSGPCRVVDQLELGSFLRRQPITAATRAFVSLGRCDEPLPPAVLSHSIYVTHRETEERSREARSSDSYLENKKAPPPTLFSLSLFRHSFNRKTRPDITSLFISAPIRSWHLQSFSRALLLISSILGFTNARLHHQVSI